MVVRSVSGFRFLAAAAVLALAGCGGTVTATPEPAATVPVSPSVSVVASPVATPKANKSPRPPSPTPTPPDPAPAELIGSWQMMLGTEKVTLDLAEHTYRVRRGPESVGGGIAVRGDEIDFSHSNVCEATGTHRWTVEAGALTFTSIQRDPCSGRAKVLDGQTYTKAP
jgi:hypothetical protein